MDKGSENFVSAFAFGYFCLRENKMLFLQYGNDEDEEIFLRLAFMQSLGGAARYLFIPGDGIRVCAAGDAGLYRFGCHARSERRVGGGHQVVAYFDRTS